MKSICISLVPEEHGPVRGPSRSGGDNDVIEGGLHGRKGMKLKEWRFMFPMIALARGCVVIGHVLLWLWSPLAPLVPSQGLRQTKRSTSPRLPVSAMAFQLFCTVSKEVLNVFFWIIAHLLHPFFCEFLYLWWLAVNNSSKYFSQLGISK